MAYIWPKKLRKDTIDKWQVVNEQLKRLKDNRVNVQEFIDKNGTISAYLWL